jgi:hypothetical protein
MAREITAGVLLNLNDQFSSKIRGAGISVQGFADKAVGVAQKVNQAFSGLAGTLGTLGVSIGAGMLIRASIDYEDAMIRIGTNAGMSAAEINRLRRELIATAGAEKVSLKEMESFAKTLADNSIGYEIISESAQFAAQAIQGLGISGQEAGDLLSVLVNRGADVDTFKQKLNNLAEIDDRLQGMGLTEFTRYIPQLMELSGASVDNIEDLYLAVLTLNNGAKNTKAIAQYTSAMQDFANSETRDKIRGFFHFDTKENGELKSFFEIMEELVARANEIGDYERFGKVLGLSDATILAMKQYNNHYRETIKKVGELGDTSDAISRRAAQNARSLHSALTGLQDAVLTQSDGLLIKPIEKLADLLNKNPDGLQKAITGVGIALGALSLIRVGAGIVSLIAHIKDIHRGGGLNVSGLANAGGGAGIPVHVTNWGGNMGLSGGQSGGGLVDQYGNPLSSRVTPMSLGPDPRLINAANFTNGARTAGIIMAATVGVTQAVGAYREIKNINANEEMTDREKSTAKGEVIGGAVGTTVGTGAGVLAGSLLAGKIGAMIGTAIAPGVGTAIGGAIGLAGGALVGWVGGWLGKKAGAAIGDMAGAMAEKEAEHESSLPVSPGIVPYNTGAPYSWIPGSTTVTNPAMAARADGYNRFSIPMGGAGFPLTYSGPGGYRQPVNDLIVTPQGQFSTHPDDYIFAMKNPAALAGELRAAEHGPRSGPPVIVDGEIVLHSELSIDDKGYRLRQSIGKNTTPYKFAVGSAKNARLI